jgi:phosphopantothenoylcysteine decarboxylase/phosphopantothenate--cysteine ligase
VTEPLAGRRVVLGVSGSISAYKALTLASRLTQAGALVDTVLTRSATRLVRPAAFQALTHRPVVTSLWRSHGPTAMDHVALARAADILVVAPATASVLARLAHGLADDALTTTALATAAPLLLAPAMEPAMWSHPATRANVAQLVERGARLVGPESGRLASGAHGEGRMAEPETLVEHVRVGLAAGGDLAGRRVLVTAGPTREPIDPVRFLSNHSSGRMGYAVARAARDRGADVVLVSGPVALAPPLGVRVVRVETAAEMQSAVLDLAPGCDVVVMTAAVADFRPAAPSASKIKKAGAASTLDLAPNADILVALDRALGDRAERPVRVGFAAETDDLVANARDKLARKGLDLVVANPVPATFGRESVDVTLVGPAGVEPLGEQSKADVADAILDRALARLDPPRGG